MTFQNIFSSTADFRAVVSKLPCRPTNKGKNHCGCAEKANRQWAFVAFWLSSYVNIKTAAAFANWLAPKKGALFSLIYFFGSFCIYYIPHNYVIPQAMPHAIPQTHSSFYPHRTSWRKFAGATGKQWRVQGRGLGGSPPSLIAGFQCHAIQNRSK